MGSGDLESLIGSGLFAHSRQAIPPSQDRAVFNGELAQLKDMSRGDLVVVYVRALACLAAGQGPVEAGAPRGQLMVLPADADPNDPVAWLPFKNILESLAQCRVHHKLLIVDVMQGVADPRLALLSGDVATWIGEELKAVPDERRLAPSCSPGQTTHVSEILGRSIFNFFLEDGLRGWADGAGRNGSSDGIVTAAELADYLAVQVDDWARRNRNSRQRPFVSGSIEPWTSPWSLCRLAGDGNISRYPRTGITPHGCSGDGGCETSGLRTVLLGRSLGFPEDEGAPGESRGSLEEPSLRGSHRERP